jgi:TetR/AcrR family transcriptional regulator, tetracycline repressor protein
MSPTSTRRTRNKLDREVLIDAALRLADADGLDAISFRRLAEQFEVTPMALYWHFADKEALLGAIADRLWQETAAVLDQALEQLDPADDDGWQQLRLTLHALVNVLQRHPAVAELAPTRVVACEAGLHLTELTLEFLARRGFEPEAASNLAGFVLCSAVMLVTTQPGIEIAGAEERAEHQRQKRIALASLPADRYPHIIASAGYLTDCEVPDSYLARGFDAIIGGVRAQAPETSSTP